MLSSYPSAEPYLKAQLYPCRHRWAYAWISTRFTAGCRTNGRSEGEHKVLQSVGNPKLSMYQVYNGLNERTNGQSAQDMIRVCDIREHAGPFAVQICYREMQESMFYSASHLQRPEGAKDWNMQNDFTNDKAYISTRWLIRLALDQGLRIWFLFKVQRLGGIATHYLVVLRDGRAICDCCMGLNLGIPCRHYFHLFTKVEGLVFSIGMIRARCVFTNVWS
ncbi:hypothetical protein F5877DRAFT_55871 [Lentinula edodes]|nr:hypothetical protein F5877DRAFT_55871 [Lentinula edodes]